MCIRDRAAIVASAQTPLNLAHGLVKAGVPIIGTGLDAIALAALIHAASAFLAPPAPAVAKTIIFKKKDKDTAEDAEPVQVNAMSKGTVVEFDLNKHTTLGVIDGHKVKAKGGLRYEIKTSDGKLHAGVAPRDIHFSATPGA